MGHAYCRGENVIDVELTVQDLHSITPNRYVEIGGDVLHTLSYQMARSYMVPVGMSGSGIFNNCSQRLTSSFTSMFSAGVFVACSGYMFHISGIARKSMITHLNNEETPDLDSFVNVAQTLKDGERVPLRYYSVTDINREKVSFITVDRHWHTFRMAVRNG
jgi:hypothetical protein